jgi:hypothetical protein
MSIKQWMYNKIKKKAEQREKLSEEIAHRGKDVENYVLNLLQELEDDISSTVNTSLFDTPAFRERYADAIKGRLRMLDNGAVAEMQWGPDKNNPHVSGLLIKWSKQYQTENNCEPELFVDISALLFK